LQALFFLSIFKNIVAIREYRERAVFLGFGFVSAQSQGVIKPVPSPKPRQNPKILAPNGYNIFSNALAYFCGMKANATAASTQINAAT